MSAGAMSGEMAIDGNEDSKPHHLVNRETLAVEEEAVVEVEVEAQAQGRLDRLH